MTMKLHQGLMRPNRFGGTTFTTLCGRMNAASVDGMNIGQTPADVTCLFCRKDRRWPDVLHAEAEAASVAAYDAALADAREHSSPLLTAEEGPGCKPPTSS